MRVVAVNDIDEWDDQSASDYTIVRCANEESQDEPVNFSATSSVVTGFIWPTEMEDPSDVYLGEDVEEELNVSQSITYLVTLGSEQNGRLALEDPKLGQHWELSDMDPLGISGFVDGFTDETLSAANLGFPGTVFSCYVTVPNTNIHDKQLYKIRSKNCKGWGPFSAEP
eukprot:Skav207758  [mRNA]  locus=scaffold181:212103:214658:+ [translate_table: standard]